MPVLKRVRVSEDGGVAQFAWEYGSEAVEPFLVFRHRLFCTQAVCVGRKPVGWTGCAHGSVYVWGFPMEVKAAHLHALPRME